MGGHNIKIDNISFERVEEIQHLETNLQIKIPFMKKVRVD
jgi:hypothetical protein